VFDLQDMAESVQGFVRGCLHCMRVGNSMAPRPFGEAIHATKPNEVIHFDFISIPMSVDGQSYVLVINDDMSGFVELISCPAPTAREVYQGLADWFKRFGVVR